MLVSYIRIAMLTVISAALLSGYHSLSYKDLEDLGVNCPSRDRCEGYRNNLSFMDRSCECDSSCTAYKDCCIDALPNREQQVSRPSPRTDVECLHYGVDRHTGVYVISKCSSKWSGSPEVRKKCHARNNFRDPLVATPVTDVLRNETYRNSACAECNNANMGSLKYFLLELACEGLSGLSEAQIMGDLIYSQRRRLWGVHRLNRFRNGTVFVGCDIIFDVPEYLTNNVRFCRSNLISKCAADWARPEDEELCELYTTAVYSSSAGYRNPHCAICNYKTVDEISCQSELFGRKRPMSFALLLDVNPSDGEEVGMRRVPTPACPSGYKYDPFFKKCRELVCALPNHVVKNDKCVRV